MVEESYHTFKLLKWGGAEGGANLSHDIELRITSYGRYFWAFPRIPHNKATSVKSFFHQIFLDNIKL